MNYRIRFAKTGRMRYVGHLDLMRFFQKALRRADIPLAFSQGFHPHPLISFAAPLSVGVTSEGEYMDIVTEEALDIDVALFRLNEEMAEGMHILSILTLPDKARNAMAAVDAASYYVYFKTVDISDEIKKLLTIDTLANAIDRYYSKATSIPIVKKTKKSEREVDLKSLVYDFKVNSVSEDEDIFFEIDDFHLLDTDPVFYTCLSGGSTDNIKPELLISHFLSFVGLNEENYTLGIHRIDMLHRWDDGKLISLSKVNE